MLTVEKEQSQATQSDQMHDDDAISMRLRPPWDLSNGSILILEDEPRPGAVIRNHFVEQGYHAELFANLQDAIEALVRDVFAVVVADCYIGNGTAIELVRFTRRRQPWIWCVGISQVSATPEVRQLELVCDAFVPKDPDMSIFLSALDKGVHDASVERKHSIAKLAPEGSLPAQPPGEHQAGKGEPNYRAYKAMEEELRRKYMGEYVAFVHGKFAGHGPDRSALISKVYKEFSETDMLVQKVTKEREVARVHSPLSIDTGLK